MRPTRDAKQRIKRMSRKIKDLHSRAQELERQHRTLAIQHHVMLCCCELLDWMRSSPDMHPGWCAYQEGLLPEELPLLEQLGTNPVHDGPPRQPKQQQRQSAPHAAAAGAQREDEDEQQQAESTGETRQQQAGQQQQIKEVQQAGPQDAAMPAQRAASCGSATARVPSRTTTGLAALAAAASPGPADGGDAAGPEQDLEDPLGSPEPEDGGVVPSPEAELSLEAFFDGAQNWQLSDQPPCNVSPGPPSTGCASTAAGAATPTPHEAQPGSETAPGAGSSDGPHAAAAAAASTAAGSKFDRSMLYIAAPGDFLGPLRDAFSRPPYPGADSMSVQQLGELYCGLVDVNACMMGQLQRMQRGEQLQHEGPHPVAVMKAKLVTHVGLIATAMLLHPDDVLNKFRMLNNSTMQLEEDCADKAWDRMWAAVDDLGFTEQQQYLISIGCDIFKRLISGVMQERQALAARQQELLKVDNGRSIDIQEQQTCADRLHLVVKKERFLSQCWGTYVTSVCSVVQIAQLSLNFWPYSPQIAVMGAVLSRKLEEREEQQQQEKERRRRRMHGLVLSPAVLAGTATSS